ncbi:N-acetylneuraminate synthase [Carboxydocella sp. JDF658]|nr:N-acetylneuraminate synthase [Carboxydocella sp. JDF658]
MRMIVLKDRQIGPEQPVFIIAEAGVNHNGDLQLAKKMIDVAAAAGADAIKFQTFKAEKLVTRNAPKADYQKKSTETGESQFAMLKKLELSEQDHYELFAYCQAKGIRFMSTPFDEESLLFLHSLGVELFKISSGDLNNQPFLHKINSLGKPVILSTGMANLSEITEAVQILSNCPLVLLHCTTAYPTPVEIVNLRAINLLQEKFGPMVGYSDHTLGTEVAVAAVALGAFVIEKHFTMDKNLPGPDQQASLNPEELTLMVRQIRNVEKALGNKRKECTEIETANKLVARKSIVSSQFIPSGVTIREDMIAIKRPGTGIEPGLYSKVIGRKAKVDIAPDQPLTWDMLE